MGRRDIFWSLTLLFISFLAAVDSSKHRIPDCPDDQEFSHCGSSCNETCDVRYEDMVCDKRCVQRCRCLAEAPVWHNGRCIPRRGCPGEEDVEESLTSKTVTPKCPRPQVYSECGSACNLTCAYPSESVCSRDCVGRCECPSTAPIWHAGKCIRFEDCPKDVGPVLPSDFDCPKGQIFQFCGSECNHTCEHGEEGPGCPHICVKRCGCPQLKPVWHEGRCVEYEKCKEKDDTYERDLTITEPITKPVSPLSKTTPEPETERSIPRSLEKQIDKTLRILLEAIESLKPST